MDGEDDPYALLGILALQICSRLRVGRSPFLDE